MQYSRKYAKNIKNINAIIYSDNYCYVKDMTTNIIPDLQQQSGGRMD